MSFRLDFHDEKGSNIVNKILTLSMKLLSTDGDWLGPCWSSWSSSDVDGLKQVVKHCDSRLKNAVKCRPICCQMGELFAILSLEIKNNVRMGIVAKLFSESFWSHFWNLTNKTAFLWRVSLLVLDDQLIGNYWILKDQILSRSIILDIFATKILMKHIKMLKFSIVF